MASRDRVADAEECKAKGNEALKAKDFDKAIEWYTQAIAMHRGHVYFSNRSAAYLSKNFADSALKDAEECISIKPDWAKGYSRKGAALHKLQKYEKSAEAYRKGLEIDPDNAGLKAGLDAVLAEQAGPAPGAPGAGGNPLGQMFAGLMDKVKASPRLSKYLSDPSYVNMINTMQTNPNMMQAYMQDPRMMETLSEVLGIQFQPQETEEEKEKREEEEKKRKIEKEKREKEAAEAKAKAEYEALSPEEKEKLAKKEEAKKHKERGNAHYKKKEFKEALAAYEEAIATDPTDMTFLTNKAAVILEQGDLEGCLKECEKAIEIGRKHQADYALIGKAFARMGNALYKHNDMDGALKYYNKAQLENRTPQVAKRIKNAEKKKKESEAKAYLDPEKGKEAKAAGNDKFKAGDWPGAIKDYSEAIKRDPEQSVYYNNRAAAYMKLMDFGRAMDDCKKAIEIDPKFIKAWGRKGNIEFFLKEYHKAMDSYKKGLELDPENQVCKDGLAKTAYAVRTQSGEANQQRASRAMEDPEIRNIMTDPIMKQVLSDMSTDPASAAQHMSNPEVAGKIEKLIAAGIIQTR